jgi:hypothetical protein
MIVTITGTFKDENDLFLKVLDKFRQRGWRYFI